MQGRIAVSRITITVSSAAQRFCFLIPFIPSVYVISSPKIRIVCFHRVDHIFDISEIGSFFLGGIANHDMMKTVLRQEIKIRLYSFSFTGDAVGPQTSVLFILLNIRIFLLMSDCFEKRLLRQFSLILHTVECQSGFPVRRYSARTRIILVKEEDGRILHAETGSAVKIFTHCRL